MHKPRFKVPFKNPYLLDTQNESGSLSSMTERDIILSYGLFYHATAVTNWANISVDGLKPTAAGYELTGCKGRPLICLSIPKMKHKWVSAIADKYDGMDIAILEIPAEVIANRSFALDKTSAELKFQSQRLGTDDFKMLLDAVGDFVCFDPIPARMICLCETCASKRSS
jgi:hypothetical protein